MPDRIGSYEVVGRLAFGGTSGEGWLARSQAGQPVAIQQLPRTARGSLALHPNLVEIREVVRAGDERYRIMEYLEGETLAGLIRRLIKKREQIEVGLAAHMIAEVCDGLHAAHVAGELHRAVSPATVFITYGGGIKVLELGTATTDPGSLYLSPEQLANQPLGRQSDVYAIGLVLYELTTLRRVFDDARDRARDLPPPSTQTVSYPPQLEAICMQALARDPAQRFRSALAMRDALLEAARVLDTSGDPTRSLASKLMRLFGDRIAAKRTLLDRVKVGGPPGVPLGDPVVGEADEEVQVPVISRDLVEQRPGAPPPFGLPALARASPELPAWPARPARRTAAIQGAASPYETGEVITLGLGAPPMPATAPTTPTIPSHARRVRWGVVVMFLIAIACGAASGAWLRWNGLPF